MYFFYYYYSFNKILREAKTETQCWALRYGQKAFGIM